MKLLQRILCTCLVLLLLTATAAGCGEPPDDPSISGSDTLTVTEGETVDEAAKALEAIDEVDYGGREFTVLHAEGTNFEEELIGMPDIADAVASGIINDAVFERNTEFELRCKLTYVKVPANNMSMLGMLTNEIAAGLQYIKTQPSTGEISLALDKAGLEKATNVLERMLTMIYDEHAIYMGSSSEFDNAATLFIGEQAMFFSENAYYLRSIASTMEADFGIVPVPKYDANQENYHTWAHSIGSTLCLPVSFEDTEMLAKIVETYVILSYQHVTPAYYETLLGSRNVRDPESAEILADIFANRVYDMAQYYRTFNLADLFYNCVNNNQKGFVSSYEKTAQRFERNLDQIMKKLNADK